MGLLVEQEQEVGVDALTGLVEEGVLVCEERNVVQ